MITELCSLKTTIIVAIDYIDHSRYCEIDQCDVCTCGMVTARENLKMAFNAMQKICFEREENA